MEAAGRELKLNFPDMKSPETKAVAAIFEGTGSKLLFQFDRKQDDILRLPGGRIRSGETAKECLRREITEEEYGVEFSAERLWLIVENFFQSGETSGHEIVLVFAARFTVGDRKTCYRHNEHKDIFLKWVDLTDLHRFKILPAGVDAYLNNRPRRLRHFSNRDRIGDWTGNDEFFRL